MGLEVVLEDLGEDLCGFYDHATETVYINRRLSIRDRRCTLVHELIHWERGHEPTDNLSRHTAREVEVDHEAARRLISFPQLMWAMTYFGTGSGNAAAEALDVEPSAYLSRVLAMTRLEQVILDVCALQCIGIRSELALSAGSEPALLNLPRVVDERILDGIDCVDAA
jgi:hypothetical protein